MDKKQLQSLLVIVLGFITLGYIFNVESLKLLGYLIGLISIIIPAIGRLVLKIWEYIALALGWFNSRVLLSVVFYVIVVPFAYLSRIFQKDKLMLKRSKRGSVFQTRSYTYQAKDLDNPW